jgi:hypothetical protein
MQLNCHKSRVVVTSLEADTPDNSPFVYCIQEPYLWNGNPCGLTK